MRVDNPAPTSQVVPPQGPLPRAEPVTLEYAGAQGTVRALDDASFEVYRGDRFVLLGPSGCGKSTLRTRCRVA
ncbi:MAG: sulfonate transporter ATP-binding protein [Paucimonas sp.]|nr:sulfonate transporter ATP-binding protein [Paucimonas sp.]